MEWLESVRGVLEESRGVAGKCSRSIGGVSKSGWKVFEDYRKGIEEWYSG